MLPDDHVLRELCDKLAALAFGDGIIEMPAKDLLEEVEAFAAAHPGLSDVRYCKEHDLIYIWPRVPSEGEGCPHCEAEHE